MNFVKNLFSVKYYTDILTGHSHFKPILAAIFLATILTIKPSIFIFKDMYPVVQNLEKKTLALVDEIYPQELEIKIASGQVSTNVTEPYYVTVRQETLEGLLSLKHEDQNTKSKIRLLAIDTKGKADEFERYQSFVKEQAIKKTGRVTEALPNATFRVKLDEGGDILAHLSGRMRVNHIKVLVGDKVTVEMSPYDATRGRIVLRTK